MPPSQRVVSSIAEAKESDAPIAHSTPAPISAQRPQSDVAALPETSSASARPASAIGMAISTRGRGRSPPEAQESSESTSG